MCILDFSWPALPLHSTLPCMRNVFCVTMRTASSLHRLIYLFDRQRGPELRECKPTLNEASGGIPQLVHPVCPSCCHLVGHLLQNMQPSVQDGQPDGNSRLPVAIS